MPLGFGQKSASEIRSVGYDCESKKRSKKTYMQREANKKSETDVM